MMYRMRRRWYPLLTAGITAALLVGVGSGVATALSPYQVHVKVVPKSIPLHTYFKIKYTGVSHKTSVLTVFVNPKMSCAAAAGQNKGIRLFSKHVTGSFAGFIRHFSRSPGQHRACAYLTARSPVQKQFGGTRARAGVLYTTLG